MFSLQYYPLKVYSFVDQMLIMLTLINDDQVPAALTTFPSTAQIVSEPLGVVLVISAWNYPFCKLNGAFMFHTRNCINTVIP